MNKKVIITGVTGQDGSYMADYLLANTNCVVYGMIRRSAKPDYSNLTEAMKNPRFKLVFGDLSDANSIENLVREYQPDYFFNFAAQSFVGASWQLPEQTFDVTATGVLRILESIRKHAPTCRFYSAGSSEEMGDVLYSPQDLKHPIRPRSPYGAAKAAARHLTKVYRESYNLYAIHCILYNHESERRGEEFVTRKITKGVARICDAIQKGKPIQPIELGNLDSKRDWSHAKDFVEAVWFMMNQDVNRFIHHPSDEERGKKWDNSFAKSYILSSDETHSIREFVEKAFKAAFPNWNSFCWKGEGLDETYGFTMRGHNIGCPEEGVLDRWVPVVKINPKFYRPAEVDLLWGDSSAARNELGWKPKVSFDDLVKGMVQNDIDIIRNNG